MALRPIAFSYSRMALLGVVRERWTPGRELVASDFLRQLATHPLDSPGQRWTALRAVSGQDAKCHVKGAQPLTGVGTLSTTPST